MVCDKVVCVSEQTGGGGGEEGGGGGAGWYRIKNKNPTQRWGKKCRPDLSSIGSKRQDGFVVATVQVTAFNQVLSNVLNR